MTFFVFFFNDTATTEIYTLSLHDALPIFQFGRAAYKAGLVNRRALARDAWENLLFRLRGSTDEGTDALRERIAQLLEGVRVRDLQRLAPDVLAGVLPRLYPRMLAIAYEHQDAGRPIFICTAARSEERRVGKEC